MCASLLVLLSCVVVTTTSVHSLSNNLIVYIELMFDCTLSLYNLCVLITLLLDDVTADFSFKSLFQVTLL